jgi:hypothetical protein
MFVVAGIDAGGVSTQGNIPVAVTRSNESAKKVAEIVKTGLKNLDGSIEGMSITEGDIDDITAEWQGVKSQKSLQCKSIRHGELIAVDLNAKSEREKYELLCEDSESDMVVLCFHGGGFMYGSLCRPIADFRFADPVAHRPLSIKLAGRQKCRVFSIRSQTVITSNLLE